jgi:hypothetical protein
MKYVAPNLETILGHDEQVNGLTTGAPVRYPPTHFLENV